MGGGGNIPSHGRKRTGSSSIDIIGRKKNLKHIYVYFIFYFSWSNRWPSTDVLSLGFFIFRRVLIHVHDRHRVAEHRHGV